ncbi:MAG: hypothetical protein K8R85_15395 [Bacteroidetes bacterium]|nr:hypothetical protein [Bacteroidota bacterium]
MNVVLSLNGLGYTLIAAKEPIKSLIPRGDTKVLIVVLVTIAVLKSK